MAKILLFDHAINNGCQDLANVRWARVPEPGSLPLAALGIAIGALTVARRRRMQ